MAFINPAENPEDNIILSVGIIFKNEIRCLERCLKSIDVIKAKIHCEIVAADTGSDDGSREVAEKYADILVDFPWINDFSAARNAVLDHCRGMWVLTLDADEWLTDESLPADFANMLTDEKIYEYELIMISQRNYVNDELTEYQDTPVPRLMRRIGEYGSVRYHNLIHEYPCYENRGEEVILNKKYSCTGLFLHHDGYLESTGVSSKIRDRNMPLLLKELEKDPTNIRTLLECSQSESSDEAALDYILRAIEASKLKIYDDEPIVSTIYFETLERLVKAGDADRYFELLAEWRTRRPDSMIRKIEGLGQATDFADSLGDSEKAVYYGEMWLRYTKNLNPATIKLSDEYLYGIPNLKLEPKSRMRECCVVFRNAVLEEDWKCADAAVKYLTGIDPVPDYVEFTVHNILAYREHLDKKTADIFLSKITEFCGQSADAAEGLLKATAGLEDINGVEEKIYSMVAEASKTLAGDSETPTVGEYIPELYRLAVKITSCEAHIAAGEWVPAVKDLKSALEDAPEFKELVSWRSRCITAMADKAGAADTDTNLSGNQDAPQAASPAPSAEMLALADQIREILARFPADDPNVIAIKASPAYQMVKELIER